jgi:hypothetical protein
MGCPLLSSLVTETMRASIAASHLHRSMHRSLRHISAVMQEVSERLAYRLAGVFFVIYETRTRVYFKAKIFAVGCFLQVDAGKRQTEFLSYAKASFGYISRQRDRLHFNGDVVPPGVTIIDRFRYNLCRKQLVANSVYADIVTRNECLKLSGPMPQQVKPFEARSVEPPDESIELR